MKISQADRWFSRCVREAADWTCDRCGTQYEPKSQGLHCSHLYSRRHRATRWEPLNAVAHCYSCHQWYGGNPIESGIWAENHLGKGAAEILRDKHNQIVKIPKAEEKLIAKHYLDEYLRLLDRRANGEAGRLEFTGYF